MMLKAEWKSRVYDAFSPDRERITEIQKLMHRENIIGLRWLMEDSVDDLIEEVLQPIGVGEEAIHNARISNLTDRQNMYSELMEMIIEELEDGEGESNQRLQRVEGT